MAAVSALPAQVAPPDFEFADRIAGRLIALPFRTGPDGSPTVGPGADAIDADLMAALALERATGRAGEIIAVPTGLDSEPALVLLVGIGAGSPEDYRRAGAALARRVRDHEVVDTTVVAEDPEAALEPFVAGMTLASFNLTWRAEPEFVPVATVRLVGLDQTHQAALDRAVAIARAGWRARFLATVPSNLKNPQWLADQARELGREYGLDITVWDEEQLAADGFGGILAVGSGSVTPPRLIRIDHNPGRKARRTVVLVGKGITFDSGGLNLKPGASMLTMKRDMTGGAVVLAVMAALKQLNCPIRVIGLIPAAENAVSGSAMRPSDVIRHYGGRTSEVTNTDAEGRLVLADAMAYAVERIKPDLLVDIATLTGAMKVALGQHVGGFFATSDELAAQVSAAGAASGEPVWRMPLASVYEPRLSSRIADADNAPGGPGAITAALFLQHFTGGLDWVHLDVASVGDSPAERDEWTTGPSGFGARLLLTWLTTGSN